MGKYYAVKKGRNVGIFETWKEAETQVKGFSGASYKSFDSMDEAAAFIDSTDKNSAAEEKNFSEEETIKIYVDGSFSSGKKCYGSGWVAVVKDEVYRKNSFSGDDARYLESWQIAGELLATIDAIQWSIEKGYKCVTIYYDYEGIEKWAMKEWKATKDVSRDYIKNYQVFSEKINIVFSKVKAHSQNKYNDMADKLAKSSLLEKGSRSNTDGSITVYGIDNDELDIILDYICSENENISLVVNQQSQNHCINYTLTLGNEKVVVNYYETGTTFIQGKESSLMENVLVMLLQLVSSETEVVEKLNEYNNVSIDSEIVRRLFDENLPNYDAKKIKSEKIERILMTAAYNMSLDTVRPDYTDLVMPILRIQEAFLHEMLKYAGLRTISEKGNGKVVNNFSYFDYIENEYVLQEAHRTVFKSDENKLKTLNNIYNFYVNNRHTLFHWDSDHEDSRLIETMAEARALIKAGFEKIDNFYIYF